MGTIDIVMAKKAYEKAQKKLAEKAAIDAKKALKSDVDLMTEETKLAEVAAIVEQPAPPVVPVVTVLPGPVKTVEETATGKAVKAKNDNRQIQFVATAQDLLKREKIAFGECRTDKNKVMPNDLIVYHVNSEFLQVWRVEHVSKAGTLTLELYSRHDSLGQNKGTAGAWTTENWKSDGLKNVFASKASSREKFLRIAIFASK